MSKRILIFGTYPIVHPQHGGQHRVTAIVNQYKKSGMDVKYVGVFFDAFYADKGADDIALGGRPEDMSELEKYTTDVSAGAAIWEDTSVRSKVRQAIESFQPDTIQIEQMFPFFGLGPLLDSMSWQGIVIYSSHNIEYELKETILSGTSCNTEDVRMMLDRVHKMEDQLTSRADIIISCTTKDQACYKKVNSAARFILAPNGIEPQIPNEDASDELRQEYAGRGIDDVVLYVGSGHPPNLVGFEQMVGFGAAFIPSNARIVVVGGVSDMIWAKLLDQPNYIRIGFEKRVELLGRVTDRKLGALLSLAKVIMLPITEGSGSNLKTAEAILAGKSIVATRHSFRSYERFEKLSGIYFANNQKQFRKKLIESLEAPYLKRSSDETALSTEVSWSHALKSMTELVGAYEK